MWSLLKEINLIRGIYIAFVCLLGCSGMEQSEQDKLRRLNSKGEFIHRKSGENEYPLLEPVHWVREAYPWEKQRQRNGDSVIATPEKRIH